MIAEVNQAAHIEGNGYVVQVVGDGNIVTAGYPHLRLTRYEGRRIGSGTEPPTDTALIRATARSIPLLGRDGARRDLWDWLNTDRSISVRVLIGPGGRGKTRLALDFCDEAVANGWQAGFVTSREMRRFQAQQNLADWGWRRSTLIVVDYAACHARQLRDWLAELVDNEREAGSPPLRLLLLERAADTQQGWWETAFGRGGEEAEAVRGLLDPAEPVPLPELPPGTARRAVIEETLRRSGSDLALAPQGEDLEFDRKLETVSWAGDPLFLMMAAQLARDAEFSRLLSLPRGEVALQVADREIARIDRVMDQQGVPNPFGRHMAAAVTLAEGMERGTALNLIEAERRALRRDAAGDAASIYEALRTALFESDRRIDPIQPDIVGEAVLLRVWSDGDEGAVLRTLEAAGDGVIRTVIRTCQDFAFDGNAAPLDWLDCLGDALSRELPALLTLIATLPEQTTVLRERAASLTALAVEMLRELARQGQSEHLQHLLAACLNNLSTRLSDLGRREEALHACEEAIEIRRALAEEAPNAFRPVLPISLNNLSIYLSDLGRWEEALRAGEETVEIYRALAAELPDTYSSNLGTSIHNLSNRLAALGRYEEALRACEEAVEVRRSLAAERPDAFGLDLAMSLNSLSNRLCDLGRQGEALHACRESVEMCRKLAAERPDAFRPDLAGALNNLAGCLSALGRHEEAVRACEEAVDVFQALAAERPDAFEPDLAMSLNNLSNGYAAVGRHEEALRVCESAVELYRALTTAKPDAFRRQHAMSLNNLSSSLASLGRQEEALSTCEQAVDIYRVLVAERPNAFRRDFARCLGQHGSILGELGNPDLARDSLAEGLTTIEPVLRANPNGVAQLTRNLAKQYVNACRAAESEPDSALLGRIHQVLRTIGATQSE